MSRIKFTVTGEHPLLHLVRDYFILVRKFELVTHLSRPDFILAGTLDPFSPSYNPEHPALVLSSDIAYSDRTAQLWIPRPKSPMTEKETSIVTSVLDVQMQDLFTTLSSEGFWIRRQKPTVLLRTFNVYGPDIKSGVIPRFIYYARKDEPLPVYKPGYQTRTFLYQDDFLEIVNRFADKLLEGTTGIYNVGSTEETTILNLAKSISQFMPTPRLIGQQQCDERFRLWKLPDVTRMKAMTGYTPKMSLRQGLWTQINNPMSLYEGL